MKFGNSLRKGLGILMMLGSYNATVAQDISP